MADLGSVCKMKTRLLRMTLMPFSLFKTTIILIMGHSTMKRKEGLSATSHSTSTIATIIFTMMEELEALVITCVKTHMLCTTILL